MTKKTEQQNSEAAKAELIGSSTTVPEDEKTSPTSKEKIDKPVKKKGQVKTSTKKMSSFGTAVGLLFTLCALALAGYNFWAMQIQEPVISQTIETQHGLQKRIDQLAQQLQLAESGLSKEIEARKSEQAEHQALRAAMDNISVKLGRSTVAWRMAEVEY